MRISINLVVPNGMIAKMAKSWLESTAARALGHFPNGKYVENHLILIRNEKLNKLKNQTYI